VRTFGIIMPGENGRHQSERRDELVAAFALQDSRFAGEAHPPFSLHDNARRTAVPWTEYYEEIVTALLRRAVADGCPTIVTGVGGDEISALRVEELTEPAGRDERGEAAPVEDTQVPSFLTQAAIAAFDASDELETAPEGAVEPSCYESVLAGAPNYLRVGAWPVSPYCDPTVVRFTRRLPAEWRHGRTLQRMYLRAMGCSERVADPHVTESFLPLLREGLRGASVAYLRSLFAESRLAEMQLVDRDRLVAAYERYIETGRSDAEDSLFEAAVLEASLRAVETARA
jgi:asparagine synthase (glutamine-hydrolysing)